MYHLKYHSTKMNDMICIAKAVTDILSYTIEPWLKVVIIVRQDSHTSQMRTYN